MRDNLQMYNAHRFFSRCSSYRTNKHCSHKHLPGPSVGQSQGGFTLIEVMVAVVIFSLSALGLMQNMSVMSHNTAHARDVTIAHWVAENKMQEIYLIQRTQGAVPRGRQAGDLELAGITWDWQIESEPFPGQQWQGYYRLTVTVTKQGQKDPLAIIAGFILE